MVAQQTVHCPYDDVVINEFSAVKLAKMALAHFQLSVGSGWQYKRDFSMNDQASISAAGVNSSRRVSMRLAMACYKQAGHKQNTASCAKNGRHLNWLNWRRPFCQIIIFLA